jgi:hypothetical protein
MNLQSSSQPTISETKPVRKRRSRFIRFLRGAGWTLLGLVALVAILAVLGMIIPPPRDPKAAALDNEDFGLGFKVGDKWNVKAMDTAISARNISIHADAETEQFFNSTANPSADDMNFVSWFSKDSALELMVSSTESHEPVVVNDIYICALAPEVNLRDKKARDEAHRKLEENKAMFPGDQERQLAYMSMLDAKNAGGQFPHIKTGEGIGLGSSGDSVISSYGKPTFNSPFGDYTDMLFYFGDGNGVVFTVSMDIVNSMSATKMPSFRTPRGRLASWGVRIANWFSMKSMELSVALAERMQSRESEEPK